MIPTNWHSLGNLSGISSGILSSMYSDILTGIYFDVYSDIRSDIQSGLAGCLSGSLTGVLSGIWHLAFSLTSGMVFVGELSAGIRWGSGWRCSRRRWRWPFFWGRTKSHRQPHLASHIQNLYPDSTDSTDSTDGPFPFRPPQHWELRRASWIPSPPPRPRHPRHPQLLRPREPRAPRARPRPVPQRTRNNVEKVSSYICILCVCIYIYMLSPPQRPPSTRHLLHYAWLVSAQNHVEVTNESTLPQQHHFC